MATGQSCILRQNARGGAAIARRGSDRLHCRFRHALVQPPSAMYSLCVQRAIAAPGRAWVRVFAAGVRATAGNGLKSKKRALI